MTSTAFLFAHYFGWIEARRQAVLSSSGEGGRDIAVQRLIDGVLKTLRRSEDSEGFLFFTTEQRAIGELMLTWETVTETGARIPHVMGYAAFVERFRDDEDFRQLVHARRRGMDLVVEGRQSPAHRRSSARSSRSSTSSTRSASTPSATTWRPSSPTPSRRPRCRSRRNGPAP